LLPRMIPEDRHAADMTSSRRSSRPGNSSGSNSSDYQFVPRRVATHPSRMTPYDDLGVPGYVLARMRDRRTATQTEHLRQALTRPLCMRWWRSELQSPSECRCAGNNGPMNADTPGKKGPMNADTPGDKGPMSGGSGGVFLCGCQAVRSAGGW
jgi:hypothetical protein